jgi:DNA-directed RNA polymerase specialized sigma24 family protein
MSRSSDDEQNGTASELEADAEIVRRLAEDDFALTSPTWTKLAEVLIEYGYSVLKGWLIAGEIYEQAAKLGQGGVRGLPRIPRDLRLRVDDAHDVAASLLEAAIQRFRQTLREGRWQPDQKASLRTFFVGRCLMELPDAYQRWQRQQDRWANESPDADVFDVVDSRLSDDPSEAAITAVYFDQALSDEEHEHVRVMFKMAYNNYTVAEIAEYFTNKGFPCTEAMVRTRISRARVRARRRRDQNERGDERG